MNKKRQILLLNIFLLFSSVQVVGQQLIADQFVFDQNGVSQVAMEVSRSSQSIDLGSLVSTESISLMKNKAKMAQNILYAGLSRKVQPVGALGFESEDQLNFETQLLISFFDAQKLKNFIALSIFLLCSSGDILIGSERVGINIQEPETEVYLECIPRHVHGLPMTFATNLAGNGAAVAISSCAPSPFVAGITACCLGCFGGLLESASSDTTYFSQNFIDIHRNFKTGFVADQVCVPVSSCFKTVVPNAAAIGAPVGYAAGLCAGIAVQKCVRKDCCNLNNVAQVHIQLAPVVQMEAIERR